MDESYDVLTAQKPPDGAEGGPDGHPEREVTIDVRAGKHLVIPMSARTRYATFPIMPSLGWSIGSRQIERLRRWNTIRKR